MEALVPTLTPAEARALRYDWAFWARDKQLPPGGDWRYWLVLAGRGFGKTRTGVEWLRSEVEAGRRRRVALVAPTAADARDIMVEGESGVLAMSPPWFRPKYEPSKRRLTWPNGALATVYSADEPDRLRGPQHDAAWCDELASWRYPEAWDMLMFGLRLGDDPRCVITTTPRPIATIKELMANPATTVARGATYENRANLAPAFFADIVAKYEGTRLGRQELNAEILEDNPDALWQRTWLDGGRVTSTPDLKRIVVAVDPSVSSTDESAEAGIIVAGVGVDGHGYVLDDRSVRASPDVWMRAAVAAFHTHKADRLVAEVNNGGDMVELLLKTVDRRVPYRAVHASRGKVTRAEPVSALYEQGRVHHVGLFGALEDQLCQWVPGERSPDRLDALVWALTELMVQGKRGFVAA